MSEIASPVEESIETLWAERLAEFKSQERPEVVLLLAEDPELIRITVAWTNTSTSRPKKLTRPPQSENPHEWWEWLWQNRVYARQELMKKADQSFQGFDLKFRVLVGNRVIYPDGTVNAFVQKYLRDRVLKLFEAKAKRPSRKKT